MSSFRHYFGIFRQEHLIDSLHEVLDGVKSHGFKVVDVKPRNKDGGVFIKFTYDPNSGDDALKDILKDVKTAGSKEGGFPTWTGLKQLSGDVWPVKGKPWFEVCQFLQCIHHHLQYFCTGPQSICFTDAQSIFRRS